MKHIFLILISYFLFIIPSQGQSQRWQQSVKYTMNIDVDTLANQFKGKQKLIYQNNSNDKLDRVFYHLYWNAFQPNSSMDVRSRELGKKLVNGRQDWDGRVKDRILNLKETEIGYQKIVSLKMNGVPQKFIYHETILEVNLTTPILPKTSVVFDMEFEAQIPLQVRRSGRDNPQTGVRYSMSQWYPKLCEYDYEGWHPTPYVAREFYGVWGDFDVTINIDKSYKLGGTGVLVNASEIGWGYDKPETELKPCLTSKRSWHFKGENIHDFVWVADNHFKHISKEVRKGLDPSDTRKIDRALKTSWIINFPQGTTQPFAEGRKGTVLLIKQNHPIVIPIVINGFNNAFDKKGLKMIRKKTTLSVKFKPPLHIDYNLDNDEILETIMIAIEQSKSQQKSINLE